MERCAERRGHRRVLMAARQHGASHQARRLRERHAAARGPDAEPAGHVHLPVAHGARVGATRGVHAHALTPRAGRYRMERRPLPGRHGGGGGTRGGMSDEQRQRMHQTMQLVFDAPPALNIAETDSSVAVRSDTGAALVLYNDGRKVTQKVEGGGDIEIKGRWQGNDFVVERKGSGGGKVTEDYLLSQDGKQLYVIVKFEGGRGRSIEFRRVYDGAAAM